MKDLLLNIQNIIENYILTLLPIYEDNYHINTNMPETIFYQLLINNQHKDLNLFVENNLTNVKQIISKKKKYQKRHCIYRIKYQHNTTQLNKLLDIKLIITNSNESNINTFQTKGWIVTEKKSTQYSQNQNKNRKYIVLKLYEPIVFIYDDLDNYNDDIFFKLFINNVNITPSTTICDHDYRLNKSYWWQNIYKLYVNQIFPPDSNENLTCVIIYEIYYPCDLNDDFDVTNSSNEKYYIEKIQNKFNELENTKIKIETNSFIPPYLWKITK